MPRSPAASRATTDPRGRAGAGRRARSRRRARRARRLWQRLLRVAVGRRAHPGLAAHSGARERRLGVPLLAAAARREDARHRRHAVRRDGRHHRADAARARAGLPDHRGHEHRRLGDHARSPTRCCSCRPGRRSRSWPRRRSPPRSRRSSCSRRPSPSCAAGCSREDERALVDRAARAARQGGSGRSSWPRARAELARRYVNSRGFMFVGRGCTYPGGARGRAQAQGGQLRPRRGLRRGRAEARPDLAARRRGAAGRHRHAVLDPREADQQRDGGSRARRAGARGGDRGRRADRALRRRRALGARDATRS